MRLHPAPVLAVLASTAALAAAQWGQAVTLHAGSNTITLSAINSQPVQ